MCMVWCVWGGGGGDGVFEPALCFVRAVRFDTFAPVAVHVCVWHHARLTQARGKLCLQKNAGDTRIRNSMKRAGAKRRKLAAEQWHARCVHISSVDSTCASDNLVVGKATCQQHSPHGCTPRTEVNSCSETHSRTQPLCPHGGAGLAPAHRGRRCVSSCRPRCCLASPGHERRLGAPMAWRRRAPVGICDGDVPPGVAHT